MRHSTVVLVLVVGASFGVTAGVVALQFADRTPAPAGASRGAEDLSARGRTAAPHGPSAALPPELKELRSAVQDLVEENARLRRALKDTAARAAGATEPSEPAPATASPPASMQPAPGAPAAAPAPRPTDERPPTPKPPAARPSAAAVSGRPSTPPPALLAPGPSAAAETGESHPKPAPPAAPPTFAPAPVPAGVGNRPSGSAVPSVAGGAAPEASPSSLPAGAARPRREAVPAVAVAAASAAPRDVPGPEDQSLVAAVREVREAAGAKDRKRSERAVAEAQALLARDPAKVGALLRAFEAESAPDALEALVAAASKLAFRITAEDEGLAAKCFLRAARTDEDPARRVAALRFFQASYAYNDVVVSSLSRIAMADFQPEVRAAAVGGLWRHAGRDEVLERLALISVNDDDAGVRKAALDSVAGEYASAERVAALCLRSLEGDVDETVRRAAVYHLARHPAQGAWESTAQHLAAVLAHEKDGLTRRRVVEALVRLGGAKAAPVLESLRTDAALGADIVRLLALLAHGTTAWEELQSELVK
ncbi:MAG: HEAT repeat domain-containing protein [Planctomycetes bacterium]|nr:HEAT repeat domain-containing protein [Planctomycetota bacterium]